MIQDVARRHTTIARADRGTVRGVSKRNMIWLGAVVVVGVVVTLIANVVWGLIAAGVTLVASEVVERTRRRRLRSARGAEGSALRDAIGSRRQRR
jgi:hypothetical protein